jgi:carboxyl-terminal processing protease
MNRTYVAKLSLLVGAIVAALLLTLYRPSPEGLLPFGVGQAEVRAAPGTAMASAKASYNLTALKVINVTLVRIRDNYVDPTRIDPKGMLLAALDSVQRNVAEVLVEPQTDKNQVQVQVNDRTQTFSISDVDSPWRLSTKLKEIFRFVQAHMNDGSDLAEIEYAAVNGMLGTLDPHSVLLDPESAREMDISTSGKFGGIGIVIGMRKGNLTVINLISKSTPAARAGLKAGDHIVKINGEVTENLTLNEAMNRLRGDPNTKVLVTVQRSGMPSAVDFPITRDVIRKSSVEGRLLKGNVGYLRIDQFSQDTSRDLNAKVTELKHQGARAWVLDLRGNPGGLLEQAIRVTDLFVDSGTIVTTVGYAGKQREEKRAQPAGGESAAPLAVLVNGGSASASEIVAGALKNLNRAVVFGRTTFGKGSVQVLFDNDDGSKLKLTIAQYLTPGDLSIQSVGILPDIELIPVRVPDAIKDYRDALVLRGKSHLMREADLDAHLTSKNARQGDRPQDSLRYLYVRPKGARLPDDDDESNDLDGGPQDPADIPADDEQFVEDYEIQLVRDFVAQAAGGRRTEVLAQSRAFVQKRRTEEEAKITGALSKLQIDWAPGAKGAAPRLAATITSDKNQNVVAAGDVIAITGTVQNSGEGPAYRVHAHAKSDDFAFEDTELVFGRIDPGQSRSYTTYVKLPKDAVSRMNEVVWEFSEEHGAPVAAAPSKIAIEGQARPQFAYTYQLIDEGGNGDGLLQAGESLKLHVTVKNSGLGKSYRTTSMLKNSSGDGVVVNKGRYEIDEILPGASKTMDFTFDLKKGFPGDALFLELTVYDTTLREVVNEKLRFPVTAASAGPQAQTGLVKVTAKAGARISEGADANAASIGTAKKGAILRVTGKQGLWTRVEVSPGRPGFVDSSLVQPASGEPSASAFETTWQVTPPTVTVDPAPLETSSDRWKLSGAAVDDHHVEDVYVIVSNRDAKIDGKKVFYRSNRGTKSATRMDFSTEIPVWPGNNLVTVVARENNQVKTLKTVYVYRAKKQIAADSTQ